MKIFLSIYIWIFILASCSSHSTLVRVVRAPEIVLPNIKTISVGPFDVVNQGNINIDPLELSNRFDLSMERALSEDLTFDVTSNHSADASLSGSLTLSSSYSSSSYKTCSSTTENDSDRKELSKSQLQDKNTYDQQTRSQAKSIQQKSVQKIKRLVESRKATGERKIVHRSRTNPDRKNKEKNENRLIRNKDSTQEKNSSTVKTCTVHYTFTRNSLVTVNLNIIDNNGFVIDSEIIHHENRYSLSNNDLESSINVIKSSFLPGLWLDIASDAARSVVDKIRIRNDMTRRRFAIAKNKKQFKIANKAASEGDWNQALAIWKMEGSTNLKAKAASLYNKSIYYESIGDLESALNLVTEANNSYSRTQYSTRSNEIRILIKDAQTIENNY